MDSRRKGTQQMLGTLLADTTAVTARVRCTEEQARLNAIRRRGAEKSMSIFLHEVSQPRQHDNNVCEALASNIEAERAALMRRVAEEARHAAQKERYEIMANFERTLIEAIRDKHRGFKVSIDVTRSLL